MTRTIRRTLFAATLALGVVGATVAHEGTVLAAASGPGTTFVQSHAATLLKILKDNPAGSSTRGTKASAELGNFIDYDTMAQGSLGAEWANRSAAEKKEFTDLLRRLIEKNYIKKMDEISNYTVSYVGETPNGSDMTVATEAKNNASPRDAALDIKYVVRSSGGKLMVVDIVPEDTSYVTTYKNEFAKILKKDGWTGLIKKMNDKLTSS